MQVGVCFRLYISPGHSILRGDRDRLFSHARMMRPGQQSGIEWPFLESCDPGQKCDWARGLFVWSISSAYIVARRQEGDYVSCTVIMHAYYLRASFDPVFPFLLSVGWPDSQCRGNSLRGWKLSPLSLSLSPPPSI